MGSGPCWLIEHLMSWRHFQGIPIHSVLSLVPPPPRCISYVLMTLHGCESVRLSVGTCRWTFHRSWISYALVQATVGVGTVLIWDLI